MLMKNAALAGLLISLAPRSARAECASDQDCASVGAGYTCEEQTGVCYAPCPAGRVACGDSSHYCITEGNKCCATVGYPAQSCSPDHVCCDRPLSAGGGVTCEPSQDACNSAFDDAAVNVGGCSCRAGGSGSGGAAAFAVLLGLVAARRRRPLVRRP